MKIWKNLFGKNEKINADEIAVAPGLLLGGAVIVESGSNANGRYVKFGDGTLVCTREIAFDYTIDTVQEFPFPSSFVSVYFAGKQLDGGKSTVTIASTQQYNNIIVYNTADMSNWALRTRSHDTVVPIINLKLLAIGRWK